MFGNVICYPYHLAREQFLIVRQTIRVFVLTIFSLSAIGLAGCAPAPQPMDEVALIEFDYDVLAPLDLVHAIDIPAHDIGEDCNGNRIHDAYDWAGYIPRGPYPVGDNPRAIAKGNLNGDRRLDLVVSNYGDGTVSILHQRYDRRFETVATIDVGEDPSSVAIGDLDGDRDQDIIVGHISTISEYITVLLNDGDGINFTRENHAVSEDPFLSRPPAYVIVTDLDGGGNDIVATSGSSPGNKIVTLMSNGVFDAPQHREIPRPTVLTAADFDGDGDADLALIGADNVVAVDNGLNYDPPREFSEWYYFSFPTGPGTAEAIASGDLNGDGRIDAAVSGSEGVSVLYNSGLNWGYCTDPEDSSTCVALLFETTTSYDVPASSALALADADGDGDLDIALPIIDGDTLTILANIGGTGTFADSEGRLRATNLPVEDGPRAIVAGDLDRDGRIEFAIANKHSNDVWVIHRRSSPISMPLECWPGIRAPEHPNH